MTLRQAVKEAARRLKVSTELVKGSEIRAAIQFPGVLELEIPVGNEEETVAMLMEMHQAMIKASDQDKKRIDDYIESQVRKAQSGN